MSVVTLSLNSMQSFWFNTSWLLIYYSCGSATLSIGCFTWIQNFAWKKHPQAFPELVWVSVQGRVSVPLHRLRGCSATVAVPQSARPAGEPRVELPRPTSGIKQWSDILSTSRSLIPLKLYISTQVVTRLTTPQCTLLRLEHKYLKPRLTHST